MGTRGDRKPLRRRAAIRRTQIVDAAMHIIASRGARRFTAQLVASRVGVTPGAIFRHFETMDAIVHALVERIESLLFAEFPPEASDPIERISLFFRQRVQTIAENPLISRLLLTDQVAHVGGDSHARRIREFKRRSRDFVRETLREAEHRGLLGGVAGVEDGTILVLGAILALGHASIRISDGPGLERLARRVWRTIEATLRGVPAPGEEPTRRRTRRSVSEEWKE